MSELEVTPYHQVKPKLEWVGKIYGMDIYADTRLQSDRKRELVEEFLKRATNLADNLPE